MTGIVLEAKKHRLSQNQDGGWRLTINIHPSDDMDWLLSAPMGQRLGVVVTALDDDVGTQSGSFTPSPYIDSSSPQGLASGSAPPVADAADSPAAAPTSPLHKAIEHLYQDGGSTPVTSRGPTPQAQTRGAAEPAAKPKKHWDDYSPSQQAGIACANDAFKYWAHVRAGKIQRWDGLSFDWDRDGYGTKDEHIGVLTVRWYCGVSSRSELDTNSEAAARWRELYGMFQADTTYGEMRR